MGTLYPSWYMTSSNWFSQSTEWTREENKKFERALAIFDEQEPDRWLKVAAMIPGKTVCDVMKQYKELEEDVSDIEAGRVPVPGYLTSSFTLELVDNSNFDACRKRCLNAKSADQQRKKGVPWTEDEHRRFLLGLLKHGKGDWRNISRNFVVSKTPTQVASHAQKYFIRQQLCGVKDKRRPSIHDITTVNLTDSHTSSDGDKSSSLDQPSVFLSQQKSSGMQRALIEWNQSKDLFLSSPYEISSSDGRIFQGQYVYGDAHHGAHINPQNSVFQMPPTRHQIY